MPQFIIPLVIGVATSAITSAFTPRPDYSSLTQQPSTPSGPSAAEVAAQARADRMSKARSIRQFLPSLQEQVGGSVSPEYYAQMAALLSGNADQGSLARDVTNNWLGIDSTDIFSNLSGISGSPGLGGAGGAGLFGGGGGYGGDGGGYGLINGSDNFNWLKIAERAA